MKKTYEKPQILFEDFSLSVSIAANCEYKPKDDALFLPGEGFVFVEGCDVPMVGDIAGDGAYNEICYHVPTGTVNVFNS